MQNLVNYQRVDTIGVITINNPPVNALGVAVRRGIMAALDAGLADAAAQALVIIGAGRTFPAGADIREFGQTPQLPALPDVVAALENSPKLLIAAIHGTALGGGMEITLGSDYRIAAAGARMGLPEVTLGLLPGAGGSQRLPRLIGVDTALDIMLTGKPLAANRLQALGVVDRVVADVADLQAAAIAYARELLAEKAELRPLGKGPCASMDTQAFAKHQAFADHKRRGFEAPQAVLEAVRAACELDFTAGMARERELFIERRASQQSAALRHSFFAERACAKTPETNRAQARPIETVGVIGGGTMGAGIAIALLNAGLPVTLIERDEASLDRGIARISDNYAGQLKRGRISDTQQLQRLSQLSGATDYAALSDVDLVIEAVFEDLDVKQAVFAELDRVCKPGAVLASNTSYLDVDKLAATISRPADVIGLHFFSPAHIMKLLEVVVPKQVADDVVATAFALAKKLGKKPVRAGICDGFIGNRLLAVTRNAASYMLMDGASPYQIDQALRDFGFAMGPFEVIDLAGGDIGWASRKRQAATRDARERYIPVADALCERGWFGQKSGRGWYRYPEGARRGVEDPEVLAIVAAARQQAGITPRSFSDADIVRRYMAAMISAAANIVAEGIAQRPLDVDVVLLNGYGFPRYRGGPMHYADTVGLDNIVSDINTFAQDDAFFWQPAALLERLVAQQHTFNDLNQPR